YYNGNNKSGREKLMEPAIEGITRFRMRFKAQLEMGMNDGMLGANSWSLQTRSDDLAKAVFRFMVCQFRRISGITLRVWEVFYQAFGW
ncbi:MAG: hypothetical protein AAGU75_24070, partial [Bacillota bacterium]